MPDQLLSLRHSARTPMTNNYMIIEDMFSGKFIVYTADGLYQLGQCNTIEEAKALVRNLQSPN